MFSPTETGVSSSPCSPNRAHYTVYTVVSCGPCTAEDTRRNDERETPQTPRIISAGHRNRNAKIRNEKRENIHPTMRRTADGLQVAKEAEQNGNLRSRDAFVTEFSLGKFSTVPSDSLLCPDELYNLYRVYICILCV